MRLLTYKAVTDGCVLRVDEVTDIGNDALLCKQLKDDSKLSVNVSYTHPRIKEFISWESEDNMEGITNKDYVFVNDRECFLRSDHTGRKLDVTNEVKSVPVTAINAEHIKPLIKRLVLEDYYYYHPGTMELFELVDNEPMTPYIGEHGKVLSEGRHKTILRSKWIGNSFDFTPLLDFSWFYVIPKHMLEIGYMFDIDGEPHRVKGLVPAKLIVVENIATGVTSLKSVVVMFNNEDIKPFSDFYFNLDGVEKDTGWRRLKKK